MSPFVAQCHACGDAQLQLEEEEAVRAAIALQIETKAAAKKAELEVRCVPGLGCLRARSYVAACVRSPEAGAHASDASTCHSRIHTQTHTAHSTQNTKHLSLKIASRSTHT